MTEFLQFALLGLGIGAVYALTSQGLIVVYRGSGVLNFAHGAIGMVGAYVTWELHVERERSYLVAAVCGVAVSVIIGVVTNLLIMRPLRTASPLVRVVATLGVLITLQSATILRYSSEVKFLPSWLPTDRVTLHGDIAISVDRLYLLLAAAGVTAVLWTVFRYSRFGIATSAVAEDERTAATLGWSPTIVATANWALGSGLAAVAAILIAPIITLQVTAMTNLVLAALAAALVAGFRSFPVAFAAGVLLGVAQTVLGRYVSQQGVADSLPFLVIIAVLVIGGRTVPLRNFFLQRLPAVGTGRVRPTLAVAGILAAAAVLAFADPSWQDAATVTLGIGLILLSLVVLTGYAGQLSLAQYAIAGFGAWIVARLMHAGVPFVLSLPLSALGAGLLGVVFAVPAVRTRGISLAVVTLGLGSALELVLFRNGDYSGGAVGISTGTPKLFGLDIDALNHPTRYGLVVLAVFTIGAIVVANVRRGATGRRMMAVRTNERAAAAIGVNVGQVKFFAFVLSAALAGTGGALLSLRVPTATFEDYTSFNSIAMVAYAVIGGVGFVMGSLFGGSLSPGGLGTPLSDAIFGGITAYIPLIGGISVIVLVIANQNGIIDEFLKVARAVINARTHRRARTSSGEARRQVAEIDSPPTKARTRVAPKKLTVDRLSVTFGRTTALDAVSLTVEPGHIVGLIGPNGAGKTTLIDAITGFVKADPSTKITLHDDEVTDWRAARRARAGMARSFQSLELFEDFTVGDNLRSAADNHSVREYVRDLVAPHTAPFPPEVLAAIAEFGLDDDMDTMVQDLPYGKRRLVAIARALASGPSVLLLDEPAAGLSEVETAELALLVRRLADEWGMSILLIEHDMGFVMSISDRIAVLDFGAKIFDGTPQDAQRDNRVVDAYLGPPDAVPHEAPPVESGVPAAPPVNAPTLPATSLS